MSSSGFLPGDRVIVIKPDLHGRPEGSDGYYGHVEDFECSRGSVWVYVEGRANGKPADAVVVGGNWRFNTTDIEHTDPGNQP